MAFAPRGQSRALQAVFWLLTALILLSRVFVGVQPPTDVIAGAAVGFLSSPWSWPSQGRSGVLRISF